MEAAGVIYSERVGADLCGRWVAIYVDIEQAADCFFAHFYDLTSKAKRDSV